MSILHARFKNNRGSHITYVVCVNFIHKWQEVQLNVNFTRQI